VRYNHAMEHKILPLFAILGGLVSLGGALLKWRWFWSHHKTQSFVRWFGEPLTQAFYAVLGAFLTMAGFAGLAGIIDFR
jgi:hypothetical protein